LLNFETETMIDAGGLFRVLSAYSSRIQTGQTAMLRESNLQMDFWCQRFANR